ncbi:MAG TPA: hypothetical protein VIG48_04710 [Jatrophihabitans sp.]|jgi:hypothetical protein
MSLAAKIRRAPTRIATGAFILNSGLGKLGGDDDSAKQLHGMAAGAYPFLEKVPPKPFAKALAIGEVALGGALLAPIIPAGLAGIALTGFSASLLGMWWRTPGMHHEGSPRPTQQGIAIAKDVWLLGVGLSLVTDAALAESPITGEQARADAKATVKADARAARRVTKRAAKRARKQAESILPG